MSNKMTLDVVKEINKKYETKKRKGGSIRTGKELKKSCSMERAISNANSD